jgi:hypothetical protein
MVRSSWVLAAVAVTSLACGGIPLPQEVQDLLGAETPVTPADSDAVAEADVVPVPVDSGVVEPAAEGGAEAATDGAAAADGTAPDGSEGGGDAEAAEPKPESPKPAGNEARTTEPKPDPKPATEKPDPKPEPAEPKPGGAGPQPVTGPKGAVKVDGPGRVVLFNEATGRHPVPGDVPVGTYTIRVKFGDKPVVATGKVKVTEAGLTIKCNEGMGLCRGQ